MPTFLTGSAEPESTRYDHQAPRTARPRGNLPAAAAAAAVLIQVALAQLTLVLAVVFVIAGRLSRWRRAWLAWPAAAGVALSAVLGMQRTVAGYLAAAQRLMLLATGPGQAPGRLTHPTVALAGWRHWLPAQLPAALVVAAAEAAIVASFGKPARPARAGALVTARRGYVTFSLRRGEVATGDGGCVGVMTRTGRRAEITWREAQAGVLVTGADAAAVTSTGLELATAAIQHRKTVIIIDLARGQDYGAACVGLAGSVQAACADWQAPLLSLRDHRYDPLSCLAPDRAAGLVMAMIDWSASTAAGRSFCAGYVRTALAVLAAGQTSGARPADARTPEGIAAAGRAGAWRPSAVIGDLADLLRPGALGARLARADRAIRDRDELARRARELASGLDADPSAAAAVAAAAAQLATFAAAAGGSLLGGPRHGAGAPISLARALAERQVILIGTDRRIRGRAEVMIARMAVADLTGMLAERGEIGAPADCVAWINGCEAIGGEQLSALIALGQVTGTAVLLGTASGAAAASLAGLAGVLAVRGRAPSGMDDGRQEPPGQAVSGLDRSLLDGPRPAEPCPAQERSDAVSLRVRGARPRLVDGCRAVR